MFSYCDIYKQESLKIGNLFVGNMISNNAKMIS